MKKLLALVLTLAMVLSLAACGGKKDPTTAAPTEAPTTAAPTTEAPTTEAPTTEAPTTEAPTTEAPTTEAPTEPTTEAPTEAPGPQVMTYQEYADAALDSEVIVRGTVQLMTYNKEKKAANLFLADGDGAYYVYQMALDKKAAAKIETGTVLEIKGFKSAWSGEIEITEATYEILPDEEPVFPETADVTALGTDEELAEHMNQKVAFRNGYVVASMNPDGAFVPFLYSWNGSGQDGDDLYFQAAFGTRVITFVVESDENGPDTELYQAVKELQIDQPVDLEAFLYWYEGPQPHVSAIGAGDPGAKPEGVMTHEEYMAAEMDSEVTVEGYIQMGAMNEETVSLFLEDMEGGYYVFRMNYEKEDAPEFLLGQKIRITGFKTEWNGEIEISDGKYTPLPGMYVTEPVNITKLINKEDELAAYMNRRVALKSAVLAPTQDADGNDQPFLYKYNGSGEDGDDLYFTVTIGGQDHVMLVESDECPAGTYVYEAVKELQIGDAIDLEALLYWYEGPQPHVYTLEKVEKPVGGMTYEEFMAAEEDSEVAVEGFVQLMTYDAEAGTANLFLAAADNLLVNQGAYYVYAMPMTEEEAADLQQYDCILVRGFKKAWSGEIEITDATFEKLEGSMMSSAIPADELFALGEGLEALMNARISLHGVIVLPSQDADGNDVPFLYKWNGSGEEGDDLYFKVLAGGKEVTMVVESTEFGPDSAEYQAVQALKIGDVLDLEAFMYWYEGPQPHVNYVRPAYEISSGEADGFGRYFLAEKDAEVTVEGYVRLVSSYWEEEGQGFINVYLDDNYGGYYIYKLPVAEEDLEQFEGDDVLLQVKGFKGEWSGMAEVVDAAEWKILEHEAGPGPDRASIDMMRLLQLEDTSSLNVYIARAMHLDAAIIVASQNEAGEEQPFLYKWNGAGEEGDDIYFNVKLGDRIVTVTVESTEFGPDTEVYQAAQALKIGDVVDLEGFLYWYEGPQPHISGIDGSIYAKVDGAVNYFEYLETEKDEPVIVDGYVQLCALYEKDGDTFANLFLHDRIGAYYVYGVKLEEDDKETFANGLFGTRMMVSGFRGEWSGEIEVVDVESYELYPDENDMFIATPADITELLGDEEALQALMNAPVCLCGAEVVASEAADGSEQPFLYKWNGSGEQGDDIYLKVKVGENEMTFVVETDEHGKDSGTYQAAEALQIGDRIDMLAYMYWYEGPQPHLCEMIPAAEPTE
ncbi:MAG: hypothetical protein IJK86_02360 [Lachnospiraceae bacterium]|nr:hypothetical protein [Lachnospiraceae bacterium]